MSRKWSRYSSVAITLALFLAIGETAWAGDLQIRIKQKATVERDSITLGDIASFNPEEDERVAALRELEVASAPPPGRDLSLNSRFLIYRLSALMGGDPGVKVKVPQNLLVHRDGQVVSVKKLTKIFKDYVFNHAPWPREVMRVDKMNTPGPVTLPRGRLAWEARERTNGDFVGETSLVVAFTVNGKVYRKVPVSGRIWVTRKIIRTAKKIEKGEIIEEKNLLQVRESTDRLSKDNVTALNQVIGKRATTTIQSGKVIKLRMVEVPPAVKKGDRVVIRAENGSIEITALGRVLEDARSGEQVRVINVASGKELFATVVGHGQVAVTF
ncbi:MAG: flagellar basal body P-ring formation chaperone FlgA [Desulfatiglandaceae bacterium]|jgi:flagellar basal body P-ring formation protein FlgA